MNKKIKSVKKILDEDNLKNVAITPKWNEIHYVCTGGCGFVTNEPGRCTSLSCYRYRNPLNECRCKNGKHGKLPTLNVLKGAPLPPNSTLKK